MTHKNSILELILTDTCEEHGYRTNAYRCTKKNNLFHVTILTQVIIGILDLWNVSTYPSIPKKFLQKSSNSTYRPHQLIVRKIRYKYIIEMLF